MSLKTFKKLSVVKFSTNFFEATEVVEVPFVSCQQDLVLIKNLYAGVNATDINLTSGRWSITESNLPFDVGLEALGIIEEIGSGVQSDHKVGDTVIWFGNQPKAYSQYLYVKPEELVSIPDVRPQFLPLIDCGLTACIGLDQLGRIQVNDKVVITAAGGGTGHIGVQWAKKKGCHVIGLCSSDDKAKLLNDLGCDRVINYKQECIDEVLTKEYPNGVDVVWETYGGYYLETLFNHLAIRGRLVIVGGITGYKTVGFPPISIPQLPAKLLRKSLSLSGFRFRDYQSLHKQYLDILFDMCANNELKVVIDLGLNTPEGAFEGIESISRAVEFLHSGNNIGKVVVKIQD